MRNKTNGRDIDNTAKNLQMLILVFIITSQLVYTCGNFLTFRSEYGRHTESQLTDLGVMIRHEINSALKFDIPLDRLGRVDVLLQGIVDDTPNLSHVQIVQNERILFQAEDSSKTLNWIEVPIEDPQYRTIAQIRLGVSQRMAQSTRQVLFDLATIVIVGLIITYEMMLFFTSRLLHVPGTEMRMTANGMISNLSTSRWRINSQELGSFLHEVSAAVEGLKQRLKKLPDSLMPPSGERFRFSAIVQPSHVRPVVFIFILATNLHGSFLPIFAGELLAQPTMLSSLFSKSVLMALPISAYMTTVMLTLLFAGAGAFKALSPFRAISIGLLSTIGGLTGCGMAGSIEALIVSRMLCGIGLAMIVLHCRQFIVDHSTDENRAFHLAGYTSAFSGGTFCSIIIGGIMADYFSYRVVFFTAAALLLVVYGFAWVVFGDGTSSQENGEKAKKGEFGRFLKLFVRDRQFLAVMFHGITTRMMFIGFYYYAIPIFLKDQFSYSDVGRIMMCYGLTSILFASRLNRYIKKSGQSRWVITGANVFLGLALGAFSILTFDTPLYLGMAGAGGLVILALSNSLTFPSQVNLLMSTETVRQIGSKTPFAVYQSVERIGSALGPLIFGAMAASFDIHQTIGFAGFICLAANLLFILFYKTGISRGDGK